MASQGQGGGPKRVADEWPCVACGVWTPEGYEREDGEVCCALCYPWTEDDDRVLRAKARERARQAEELGETETTPTAAELLADPASSKWVRLALRSALDRDPVDAANDAEVLARVLARRLEVL